MLEGIELGGGDGGGGVGGKNGGVGESSLRTVNFGQTICESHNFSSRNHTTFTRQTHFHAPNTRTTTQSLELLCCWLIKPNS
jgi:hypothetical protein